MPRGRGGHYAAQDLDDVDDYWEEDAYVDEEPEYGKDEDEQHSSEQRVGESASAKNDSVPAAAEDVCAVCLSAIAPENLAIVKGCEHEYCVHCILQWALCREAPTCPQCKAPFNYLYVHRLLDGQLSDCPVEESVCLLKRASWFVEHVKTLEKGKAWTAAMAEAGGSGGWAADEYYQHDSDEVDYDDDEALYINATHAVVNRARVLLGNRRMGEGGYMRAGRLYARPREDNNAGGAGGSSSHSHVSGTNAGNVGKPGKGRAAGSTAGAGAGGAAGALAGAAGASGGSGVKAPGQGRRAKRNARRAAADFGELSLDDY